jgi:hypothetical protein
MYTMAYADDTDGGNKQLTNEELRACRAQGLFWSAADFVGQQLHNKVRDASSALTGNAANQPWCLFLQAKGKTVPGAWAVLPAWMARRSKAVSNAIRT